MGMSPDRGVQMQVSLEHPRHGRATALMSHAVVTLRGHGAPVDAARPRLTVVFLLDVSGSMSGEPLAQVKASVELLVGLLQPSDRVGVIVFSSNPVCIADVAPVTAESRATLKRRLSALAAGGDTGMTAGVSAALAAFPKRGDNERQILVMLTDGEPSDGATAESLSALVGAARGQIATVTLGYGVRHNAELLNAIAKAGGGQYWYIPDPAEANVEFARALGAQADVVADGIELVLRPADGVEVVSILDGAKPRFAAGGLILPRPDLRDDQRHTTIVELRGEPIAEPGRWPVLDVVCRYRRAGEATLLESRAALSFDIVNGDGALDHDAHRQVALARAENARAAARAQADAGRFDAGAALLKPIVAALEALPGYAKLDGSPLSEAVEQLIDEIVAYESRPTAQQYLEFRTTNLGVDVAQGGQHVADVKMKSEVSKALLGGALGEGLEVEIQEKDGPPRVERFVQGEVTIGRVHGNDIVLPKGNISKRHTRIVVRDNKAVVVCLKSTNGTFVNGQRITSPRILREADVVTIGDFTLRVTPKT